MKKRCLFLFFFNVWQCFAREPAVLRVQPGLGDPTTQLHVLLMTLQSSFCVAWFHRKSFQSIQL